MDYSKTHYYKYTAPTNQNQARSTIPVFEVDDVPAAPGEGPAGSATPDLNANSEKDEHTPQGASNLVRWGKRKIMIKEVFMCLRICSHHPEKWKQGHSLPKPCSSDSSPFPFQ